jgi:hypothetical protein
MLAPVVFNLDSEKFEKQIVSKLQGKGNNDIGIVSWYHCHLIIFGFDFF